MPRKRLKSRSGSGGGESAQRRCCRATGYPVDLAYGSLDDVVAQRLLRSNVGYADKAGFSFVPDLRALRERFDHI